MPLSTFLSVACAPDNSKKRSGLPVVRGGISREKYHATGKESSSSAGHDWPGLGTAMLFRRTDHPAKSEPSTPPPPQKEALVLRESQGEFPSRVLSSGVIPLKAAKVQSPPAIQDAPIAVPPKVSAPPELPAVFDRSLAAHTSEDARGVAALARLEAMASLSNSSTIPQGPAPLRTHRIVDGDTLARPRRTVLRRCESLRRNLPP